MREDDVRTLEAQLKALLRRQRREWAPTAGLSRSAVHVLGAVAGRPGGRPPRQIAEEQVMTSSNVAAALRELEAAGLVTRHRDDLDNRRVNVILTAAGRALVDERRAVRDSWLGEAIDALLDDEEHAALLAAGRLIERLARFRAAPGKPV